MIRKLLIPSLATALGAALLGGCVSGYQYRDGAGDYYYGQPQVEYRDYGYGSYGGYGGYGDGPYGYGGGWGGQIGYGSGGYGSPYGYGGYGSPYGYGGYGGYGYGGYYPGGPVIIVRRGRGDHDHAHDHDHDHDDHDGDEDDRNGPIPSNPTDQHPRRGGNLDGGRPGLPPSGHWNMAPRPGSFPPGNTGVMPPRPMPSRVMPAMPRMERPQAEPTRRAHQDHDADRSLRP